MSQINKHKIAIASSLYVAIAILHICGLFFLNKIAVISKPFLMTTLVLVYLFSVKKPNFWYVSALFFSFWGDVLLLFNNQFFVFGLSSFLLAHIFYIKITRDLIQKINIKKLFISTLPFALFSAYFLTLIYDKLGDMKIPVIFYTGIISVFGSFTLLNYLQKNTTGNLWLLLGSSLFILSDSLIGLDRFYLTNDNFQIYIMITYILAQYLICRSLIKNAYQE